MIRIEEEKCTGCGLCIKDCFPNKIELVDNKARPKESRCMECGHCVAICPENAVSLENYPMEEVKSYEEGKFEISDENYLRSLKFRRTIRQFSNKVVDKSQIEKIIEAGRYSPTGGNLQNVSYFVLQDDIDLVKNMALDTLYKISNDSNNNLSSTPYGQMWTKLYNDYNGPEKKDGLFFNAGTVILVTSKSVHNGCIAAAHMETMIYAQKLGMLYSGFFVTAATYSKEIKSYLNLSDGEEVVACLVIGNPSVKYKRTAPRKEASVIYR